MLKNMQSPAKKARAMSPHAKKSGEEPGTSSSSAGPSSARPPVSTPSDPDTSLLPLEEDDDEGDDETIDYRSFQGDPDDQNMYAQDICLSR